MTRAFKEIRAHDVVKAFGRTIAVAGVDVTLSEGTITTIEGANGSGKSTLLLILALLMRPTRGEVLVDGARPSARAATRGRIGLVAHFPAAYLDLTARENLLLAAKLCQIAEPRKVDGLIERFKMVDFCDRPMRTYSRGQQQRTSLARAILTEPKLLLLDEPATGLDADGAEELDRVLREEKERGAIIAIATHNQQLAERIADRRVRLEAGRVVAGGSA